MTTLMFALAATLLVVCLIQFAAILGMRSMLQWANEDLESLGNLPVRVRELEDLVDQVNETIETLTKQRDDAVEEVTRISCELAVAKLSLKNAQNQFEEQSQITLQVENEREEYRDMLKSMANVLVNERDLLREVLTEWQDFESQGG